MTENNNLTTPEGISSALNAVQDEVLKLMSLVQDMELSPEHRKLLMAKVNLIESISRHGVDVRTDDEKQM